MVSLAPILGGLLSGLIGGALAVELRARRRRRIEEQQWYERTIQLASRVIRAHADDYNTDKAIFARNTSAGVLGQLTTHIMDAPPRASDDVLEETDELAYFLQTVMNQDASMYDRIPGSIQPEMDHAEETAKSVVNIASEEKKEIPPLGLIESGKGGLRRIWNAAKSKLADTPYPDA